MCPRAQICSSSVVLAALRRPIHKSLKIIVLSFNVVVHVSKKAKFFLFSLKPYQMMHRITFTIYYRIFLRSNMTPKGYKTFFPIHAGMQWASFAIEPCEVLYPSSVRHSFELRTLSTQLSKAQWLKGL